MFGVGFGFRGDDRILQLVGYCGRWARGQSPAVGEEYLNISLAIQFLQSFVHDLADLIERKRTVEHAEQFRTRVSEYCETIREYVDNTPELEQRCNDPGSLAAIAAERLERLVAGWVDELSIEEPNNADLRQVVEDVLYELAPDIPERDPDEDLLDEVLSKITGPKQRDLLKFLWTKPRAKVSALEAKVWRDPVQPGTITATATRLNTKLCDIGYGDRFTVEVRGEYVVLNRLAND